MKIIVAFAVFFVVFFITHDEITASSCDPPSNDPNSVVNQIGDLIQPLSDLIMQLLKALTLLITEENSPDKDSRDNVIKTLRIVVKDVKASGQKITKLISQLIDAFDLDPKDIMPPKPHKGHKNW